MEFIELSKTIKVGKNVPNTKLFKFTGWILGEISG
jgi:hypothetical protein